MGNNIILISSIIGISTILSGTFINYNINKYKYIKHKDYKDKIEQIERIKKVEQIKKVFDINETDHDEVFNKYHIIRSEINDYFNRKNKLIEEYNNKHNVKGLRALVRLEPNPCSYDDFESVKKIYDEINDETDNDVIDNKF